jgi:radical SAM protein with 4Fe4S-binding SPASM domain
VGNQFLDVGDTAIEFTRAEQEAYWRFHLGTRVLYAFGRMCRRPISLQLDNLQGCQLRCSYCYAETWNDNGQRVSPDRLRELQKQFQFQSASFFGGDPFYDWGYTSACLDAMGTLKQIQVSTNGIGVTNDRLEKLAQHATEDFTFQLSIEPPSWGARKSGNGKSQSDVLGDRIAKLDKKWGVHIGLAIPRSGLTSWESLDEILAFFQATVGDRPWTANWKLEENTDETAPTYDVVTLPPWFSAWLSDEWFAALGEGYNSQRCNRGVCGTKVASLLKNADPLSRPSTFWACQAGLGALGIGPDGNLSTCHHMAAINDPRYRVETLTPRGLWTLMHKEVSHQFNPVCGNCVARHHCGGICYVDLNNHSCESVRGKLELAMYIVKRYCPEKFAQLVQKSRHEAEQFKKNSKAFIDLVSTEAWARMLRGQCHADEMSDLLSGMTGRSPRLDTPLWELEPQLDDSVVALGF